MLFTPKKYGKDWTRLLAFSFCVGSLGFASSAVVAAWSNYELLADKIFSVVGFILAATVFGALGKAKWAEASKMTAKDR
jgi:hypothetical protein